MTDTASPDPRTVQFLPLQDIQPDPRNPKSHQLETIDASIGRFGMVDGIVRDDRTGYIISGHGRRKALEAMRDRGETPPEGVKVTPAGDWLVPVLTGWASRTDTEAAAALIAMNRTTELGGWVDEELLGLLEELDNLEDGFVGVGYGEDDLEDLRKHLQDVDLDQLADSWDGSGMGDGPSDEDPSAVGLDSTEAPILTIGLLDPAVAERWQAHRQGHQSNDEALAALLDQ